MRFPEDCQECLPFHPLERKQEAERLGKSKKGALQETGVIDALLKGIKGAFDLVGLTPILPRVFF